MATLRNTAEGGTNGTTATTANTGGTSGDAFNTVSLAGSANIGFSSAQSQKGTLSYLFTTNATDAEYLEWTTTAAASGVFRTYFYLTGVPTAGNGFIQLRTAGGGTTLATILLTVAGQGIQVQNAVPAVVFTGTGTLATSTWYRLEGSFSNGTTSTGTLNLDLYTGDGTTPISGFTCALTGQNFGTANFGRIRVGRPFASASWPNFYVDDVAYADATTTYLGPSATNVAPTFDAGSDITNGAVSSAFSRTGTGADSDGTVAAYQWEFDPASPNGGKPVGSSMALTGAATATVGGTPDVPGLYVIRGRCQDNAGAFSPYDSFKVYVAGNTISVYTITSNPGSWDLYGTPTPADIPTGLSDASSATGATSDVTSASPSIIRLRLNPLVSPMTTFDMTLDHLLIASGTGTSKVRLLEGATTRKEWVGGTDFTAPTTSSATTHFTLTSGEIATITSTLALDVELERG